jgi:hypothetical protein
MRAASGKIGGVQHRAAVLLHEEGLPAQSGADGEEGNFFEQQAPGWRKAAAGATGGAGRDLARASRTGGGREARSWNRPNGQKSRSRRTKGKGDDHGLGHRRQHVKENRQGIK